MIGSRQSLEITDPTPEFHMFRSSYKRKPGFRGLVYWQCGFALSSIFITISIAFFLLTGGLASKTWKGKEKSEEKTEFVQDAGGLEFRIGSPLDSGGSPALEPVSFTLPLPALVVRDSESSPCQQVILNPGIDPQSCWNADISPPSHINS